MGKSQEVAHNRGISIFAMDMCDGRCLISEIFDILDILDILDIFTILFWGRNTAVRHEIGSVGWIGSIGSICFGGK
jgi:hypothetical protein